MKKINLNWQDLTEENITKLYLYGDLNTTHDLTSPEIHREGSSNDAHSAQVTVELNNFYDYMTNPQSPLKYANLSQIPIVDKFFTEKNTIIIPPKYPDISGTVEMRENIHRLPEGRYTLGEVQKHFYDPEDEHGVDKHHSLQHMKIDPLSQDYDKRVYVFNSQAIHLGNEAKFVVEPNGERYIENTAPTIASEDFDFISREPSSWFSTDMATKIGNEAYLIPNIDPLGIGRTVNISYPQGGEQNATTGLYDKNPAEYTQYIHDYAKAHGNYTKEKFEEDLARYEHEYSPKIGTASVVPTMRRVVNNLWESNTTKFLDNDGNVMLYEKENVLESVYDGNYNMKDYIEENRDAKYHLVDKNGTETIMEIPRQPEAQEKETQPQSCSLLPPEMRYDNRQIAEFDVDEDENKITKDIKLSPEGYAIFEDAKDVEEIAKSNTKEPQANNADTLTKEQEILRDLYPHLYQDKSDEDEMDDQNDYGMEM